MAGIVEQPSQDYQPGSADELRHNNVYDILRGQYLSGEFALPELEEAFETLEPATELWWAHRQFMLDVKAGLVVKSTAVEVPVVSPAEVVRAEASKPSRPVREREHRPDIRSSEIYAFLEDQYIAGLDPEFMRQQLFNTQQLAALSRSRNWPVLEKYSNHPRWQEAVRTFLEDMKQPGHEPAARRLAEIILVQSNLHYADLNVADKAKANARFVEVARSVWQPFTYSGKWRYDRTQQRHYVSDEADDDAKVSLWLLEKAGVKGALDAEPVAPGATKPGFTNLDTGGAAGVSLDAKKGTIKIDNHQPNLGYPTSTANQLYRLLTGAGMLERTPTMTALVKLTVDEDNARLMQSREQFERSARTLRGLHRYFQSAEQLHNYVDSAWDELTKIEKRQRGSTPTWSQKYQAVLDRTISLDEQVKYKVGRYRKRALVPGSVLQQESIDQAKAKLGRPNHELEQEGTLVRSKRLGKVIVNLPGFEDRLKAGHDAVRAFGYDGMVIYDAGGQSFVVNTTRPGTDLSRKIKLSQGVPVRGMMIVKPMDEVPLRVSLQEILRQIEPTYKPQGKIKQYLEDWLPKHKTEKRESVSNRPATPNP